MPWFLHLLEAFRSDWPSFSYHNILFRLTLSYKIDWDSQNNVVDFSQSENLMGALRLTTL